MIYNFMKSLFIFGVWGSEYIDRFLKYGFKSKCSDVSICFGLCKVHRDIENEVNAEQIQLEHNVKNNDNNI